MSAAALIEGLCRWTDMLFPDAERGGHMKTALLDRFGDDQRAVSADVCAEIEAVAQRFARHLALEYTADGTLTPDVHAPGWEPQDPDDIRARAASVRLVERRGNGIGVLALDGLDRVDVAAPYVESAFALLDGCNSLVLDLRANGGGDPGTVALVLDRLTGPDPIHISDVVYRERTRQWWTAGGRQALPSDDACRRADRERDVLLGRGARLPPAEPWSCPPRRSGDPRRRRPRHADLRERATSAPCSPRPTCATRSRGPIGRASACSPTSRAPSDEALDRAARRPRSPLSAQTLANTTPTRS